MLDIDILTQILDIQEYIMTDLWVDYNGRNYTIHDLCYKPVPGKDCVVQSPLEYWQSNRTTLMNSEPYQYMYNCLNDLLTDNCTYLILFFVRLFFTLEGFKVWDQSASLWNQMWFLQRYLTGRIG